ncbi:MOSC domain-containing protein [bacterium]|nr:MOSC domain-containing protein [bacterium]
MRVISLNVGRPRPAAWKGKLVETGIYKQPVAGRIALHGNQLAGDGQGDRAVHGGEFKAVYAYPSEHYPFWQTELGGAPLAWGAFGENLSTEGLLESEAMIGDVYRIGTARLRVTQPRFPCSRLALRHGRDDIIERFLHSLRSGIYFAVEEEGELAAGDEILLERHGTSGITVREVAGLVAGPRDPELLRRAVALAELPPSLHKQLAGYLDESRKP